MKSRRKVENSAVSVPPIILLASEMGVQLSPDGRRNNSNARVLAHQQPQPTRTCRRLPIAHSAMPSRRTRSGGCVGVGQGPSPWTSAHNQPSCFSTKAVSALEHHRPGGYVLRIIVVALSRGRHCDSAAFFGDQFELLARAPQRLISASRTGGSRFRVVRTMMWEHAGGSAVCRRHPGEGLNTSRVRGKQIQDEPIFFFFHLYLISVTALLAKVNRGNTVENPEQHLRR